MKIVVTGGAGFIGSHLIDWLVQERWGEIVVIDNLYRGDLARIAAHCENKSIRFVQTDIRDGAALREQLAGAELVFHLAAQSNVMGAVQDADYAFTTNVVGTYNVLQAAHVCGVRRVIFASSREVYGEAAELPVAEDHPMNAKNAYGASKAAGELYARVFQTTYGLQTAVLRLANVYGQRDHNRVIPLWLEAAAAGHDLTVYGGQQVIDFIPVDLVVAALARAAGGEMLSGPINIGSGIGTPLLELAQRIMALEGVASRLDLQPARSVEVARFTADVTRMRRELGLEPPADPLLALEALWATYRMEPSS